MSPRPNRGGDFRPGAHRASARAAAYAGAQRRDGRHPAARADAEALAALLGPDWLGRPFLALDFETTGLDPVAGRVVEVGALRFVPILRDGAKWAAEGGNRITFRAEGSLASLVNPGIHIPHEVVAIHGIQDGDVENSPSFAEIAPALMALASGACIVAHNAPFDLSFLRAELARNGLPPPRGTPEGGSLDTRILAKKAFPGLPSYSLVNLAASFGIDAGNSHRALDDARSCMELMLRCAAVAVCDSREADEGRIAPEGRAAPEGRDLTARGGEALGARA